MSYAKSAGRSGRVWRRLCKILKEKGQRENLPCALCNEPIDYALKWPDKRSFAADHIVPLSLLEKGDPARQALSNMQPSHL